MKKRGRLHRKNSPSFQVIEDVSFTERTKHGKSYKNWFEEVNTISKKEMVTRIVKQFGLRRDKAGLLLSWSLRDKITLEEGYEKYKLKLIPYHQR